MSYTWGTLISFSPRPFPHSLFSGPQSPPHPSSPLPTSHPHSPLYLLFLHSTLHSPFSSSLFFLSLLRSFLSLFISSFSPQTLYFPLFSSLSPLSSPYSYSPFLPHQPRITLQSTSLFPVLPLSPHSPPLISPLSSPNFLLLVSLSPLQISPHP